MTDALPGRLGKPPVVSVLCELRASTDYQLHTIVPGVFFQSFPGDVNDVQNLPASHVPEELRKKNPSLADVPLISLRWRSHELLIGTSTFAISASRPYPGWVAFRKDAADAIRTILDAGLIKVIHRYSMKYVNIFPSPGGEADLSMLDWQLRLGTFDVQNDTTTAVRLERIDEGMVTIVEFGAPAVPMESKNSIDGSVVGTLLSIDTICQELSIPATEFAPTIVESFDRVQHRVKTIFFDCLTKPALAKLEPQYETRH